MARLALVSGLVLTATGITLVALFALMGSEVDEKGVLREPFFLLGIGAPSLALGLLLLLASALSKVTAWARSNLPR